MNVITIVGGLGQDPKTHNTEKTTIASFSIATNDWNGQEVTNWHNCKAFGKTAEIVEKYAKKGTKMAVTGSMFYTSWTDKAGEKKYGTEIVVNRVELLSAKQDVQPEPLPKVEQDILDESQDLPF